MALFTGAFFVAQVSLTKGIIKGGYNLLKMTICDGIFAETYCKSIVRKGG